MKDAFGNHWFIATHLGGSYLPEGLRTLTPFLHVYGDRVATVEDSTGNRWFIARAAEAGS